MNTIPRLVGDELNDGYRNDNEYSEIKSNKKVILIVDNYTNLDNNREIQRIFPDKFPAWMKYIILADRIPTGNDVRVPASAVSASSGTNGVAKVLTAASVKTTEGDAFPVGAVWIATVNSASGDAAVSNGYTPGTRIWILTSSTATDYGASGSGGAAVWVELAVPDYADRHHSSEAFLLTDVNDLSNLPADIKESYFFVESARVVLHKGNQSADMKTTIGNTSWFVTSKYHGDYAYQMAVKLNDPSCQICRTKIGNQWNDWAYAYAEWN